MLKIDTLHPDLMKQRSGGGAVMLFGLPFLAAGLFVMALSVGLVPAKQGPPVFVGILFGGVFATVGALLVFGRKGCVIDRHHGTITTWWGLLVPFRQRVEPLDGLTDVRLSQEVRRTNNSTYTVYPVRLGRPEGATISLEESRNYQRARQQAESVAKFLKLAMVDSTSGQEIVREAGTLDESLAHRLLRTGTTIDLPEAPANMKTHMRRKGHSVMLDIPPQGFNAATMGLALFGCIISLTVVAFFFVPILRDGKMPLAIKIAFLSFLGIFFILLPLVAVAGSAIGRAKRQVRVIVSPDLLSVEERGIFRVRRQQIAVKELEELEIQASQRPPGQEMPPALLALVSTPILARSDTMTLSFGGHLSAEEKNYLLAVTERVITGKSL